MAISKDIHLGISRWQDGKGYYMEVHIFDRKGRLAVMEPQTRHATAKELYQAIRRLRKYWKHHRVFPNFCNPNWHRLAG